MIFMVKLQPKRDLKKTLFIILLKKISNLFNHKIQKSPPCFPVNHIKNT